MSTFGDPGMSTPGVTRRRFLVLSASLGQRHLPRRAVRRALPPAATCCYRSAARAKRGAPENVGMMMATAVKLLLVEDDADTADVMTRALRKAGFDVDLCISAGAALVELELSPRPAAAIVDLGLPDAAGEIVL